jgi:ribosomal protein S18 acetylase RimI-like enzyme
MGYWQSTIPAVATLAVAAEFVVRSAGWKDFGGLATLQKQIVRQAEHLAATGNDRKEPFLYSLVKAILHRKRVHTLVAEEEGKLVGYITIVFGKFHRVRETAYIVVGVLASHRGRGIGTSLLK